MKSIILSVKHRHNENIHSGAKTNELRTKPPKIECPFKVYNFDTVSSGGCGKIVSEWICDSMETYRICMGIPKHLLDTGCVTSNEIMKYTDNGNKDLTAMHISNLVVYDEPKELSEFKKPLSVMEKMVDDDGWWLCDGCPNARWKNGHLIKCSASYCDHRIITRPPQSWCYVEEQ